MKAAFTLRLGKALDVETGVAEPDLLVEFSIARGHVRSLVGRAPKRSSDRCRRDWVIEVGDRQLMAREGLTDDADHAR
jgi:hypothetical protein